MSRNCDIRAVVGTDRLGRKLPLPEQAGALRENRLVGMFYFVCHDQNGTDGPYDVEKIIAKDPSAANDMNHPLWGPINSVAYHWGEPLFGYYLSKDEWVIRKHIEMLSYADVDFIVFDTTNRAIYFEQTTLIMRLISEYDKLDYKVPKVAFYTNTESGATVDEIYNRIYKENLYPESWFYLDGKPFIIDIRVSVALRRRRFSHTAPPSGRLTGKNWAASRGWNSYAPSASTATPKGILRS
jgi:hypothetical protein